MIARGISIDNGNAVLDEIAAAGPAGNFLSSDLTLKNFRQAYFKSDVFPRFTMEDWQDQGNPKAGDYLSQYTEELTENLRHDDKSLAIIEKGETFIAKAH